MDLSGKANEVYQRMQSSLFSRFCTCPPEPGDPPKEGVAERLPLAWIGGKDADAEPFELSFCERPPLRTPVPLGPDFRHGVLFLLRLLLVPVVPLPISH